MARARNPVRGEQHGRAKLSADQVREIRASKATVYRLAKTYAVSRRQIMRVQSGEQWRGA